jgi:hypothetical protein
MGLRSGDSGNLKAPGGVSKLGKRAYQASPGSRMLSSRLASVHSVAALPRGDGIALGGGAKLQSSLSAGKRARVDVYAYRRTRQIFNPVAREAEGSPDQVSALVPSKLTSEASLLASGFSEGRVGGAALVAPRLPGASIDKSVFALRAGSARLSAMEDAVARAVGQASPLSTLRGDDSHWRFWCVHAANLGTAAVRGDLAANCGLDVNGHQREVFIMASFVIARFTNMRARRAGGRPKPQSAVNSLSAVIRCHRRRGITMARAPVVGVLLRGLQREFVAEHGADALEPKRKEPFGPTNMRKLRSIATGTKVGSLVLDWAAPFWISYWAALCVMAQGAFRKAEMFLADASAFGPNRLSRAHLWWRLGGIVLVSPSKAQLDSATHGDCAFLKPPPAKNDPFGLTFGTHPVCLPFDPLCAFSAFAALRDLVGAFPVPEARRSTTPMFCESPRMLLPIKQSLANRVFYSLLLNIMTKARSRLYSLHSFRIWAACALLAAGASPGMIQALCRWKSEASLRIYARPNPDANMMWVKRMATVHTSSLQTAHLPVLDPPLIQFADVAHGVLTKAFHREPGDDDDDSEADSLCVG